MNYTDYISELNSILTSLDQSQMDTAVGQIEAAFLAGKTVFVAGNGGSAATASHLACDFAKTTLGHQPKGAKRRLKALALNDNTPLLTAYGNDVSYEDAFAETLRTLAHSGDVLIVISASGNSPNIISCLHAAHDLGLTTIGFLGFQGGKAKPMCDTVVLAESKNYGVIEDAHSVVMHMLTEKLKSVVASAQPVTA